MICLNYVYSQKSYLYNLWYLSEAFKKTSSDTAFSLIKELDSSSFSDFVNTFFQVLDDLLDSFGGLICALANRFLIHGQTMVTTFWEKENFELHRFHQVL